MRKRDMPLELPVVNKETYVGAKNVCVGFLVSVLLLDAIFSFWKVLQYIIVYLLTDVKLKRGID